MASFPEESGRERASRGGGIHRLPLLVQMCQQEGFFEDAKKTIQLPCVTLADFEAKYWELIGIWDAINNANVLDHNARAASYPIEFADQVTALRRDLMDEMMRVEDVLGLD